MKFKEILDMHKSLQLTIDKHSNAVKSAALQIQEAENQIRYLQELCQKQPGNSDAKERLKKLQDQLVLAKQREEKLKKCMMRAQISNAEVSVLVVELQSFEPTSDELNMECTSENLTALWSKKNRGLNRNQAKLKSEQFEIKFKEAQKNNEAVQPAVRAFQESLGLDSGDRLAGQLAAQEVLGVHDAAVPPTQDINQSELSVAAEVMGIIFEKSTATPQVLDDTLRRMRSMDRASSAKLVYEQMIKPENRDQLHTFVIGVLDVIVDEQGPIKKRDYITTLRKELDKKHGISHAGLSDKQLLEKVDPADALLLLYTLESNLGCYHVNELINKPEVELQQFKQNPERLKKLLALNLLYTGAVAAKGAPEVANQQQQGSQDDSTVTLYRGGWRGTEKQLGQDQIAQIQKYTSDLAAIKNILRGKEPGQYNDLEQSLAESARKIEDELKKLAVKSDHFRGSATSTSSDRAVAEKFAKGGNRENRALFKYEFDKAALTAAGIDISRYNEKEILIAMSTQFMFVPVAEKKITIQGVEVSEITLKAIPNRNLHRFQPHDPHKGPQTALSDTQMGAGLTLGMFDRCSVGQARDILADHGNQLAGRPLQHQQQPEPKPDSEARIAAAIAANPSLSAYVNSAPQSPLTNLYGGAQGQQQAGAGAGQGADVKGKKQDTPQSKGPP